MKEARFLIRRAEHRDILAMQAIERNAAQLFRTVGYDYCADGPIRTVEEHEHTLKVGTTLVVEEHGGVPVGFAMFEPMDEKVHLVEIDVEPAHQRRGLARQLILAGLEWALAKGFDAITLTTYRDVAWNAPFYRRLGFEEFVPGSECESLRRTIETEAAWGFAFAPRIAMRKRIP